jgi:arsenate reductase
MKTLLLVCFVLIACRNEPEPPAASVVFVCEHGAAKSVVASEYFNKLAAERGLAVRAIARGADPQANLSVSALKGLKADGMSPAVDAPRPLTASELRSSARVVAFDCEQPMMKPLKGMDACWDDVPTVSDDYPGARDRIRSHVAEMVEQLIAQSRL